MVLAKGQSIDAIGHTGGTATCKEKAVCEVCGEEYGDLNPQNHTHLDHVEAKAATKDTAGNIEYWYCPDCDKYYKDVNASEEISKTDIVIKKLADDPTKPSEPTEPTKPSEPTKPTNPDDSNKQQTPNKNTTTTPNTGDGGMMELWLAALMAAAIGFGGTIIYKRKRK